MAKLRLTICLLAVVLMPLALTAWVGRLLWNEEVSRWEASRRLQMELRLQKRQSALSGQIQSIASRLDGLLSALPLSTEALLELQRKEPLVRHAFIADAAGILTSPDVRRSSALSTDDEQFLERTLSVWKTGKPLGAMNVRESDGRAGAPPAGGWHLWIHEGGPGWLYWRRRSDGQTVGVEIEAVAFLGLLLAKLPDEDGAGTGCVRLAAADGAILQQWGGFDPPAGAAPALTLPCVAPLQSWHWEYFPAPGIGYGPSPWPYAFGAAGAAALVAGIALILLTTWRREMRLAAQRVSFVNQVSHELKTPLTNIRLYSELARSQVSGDAARFLGVVEEEASRLARLINNVLTFASHERRSLDLHLQEGDLQAVTLRVADHWRPVLARKGIALDVQNEAVGAASFDSDATEQILGNLLSNVEKYARGAKRAVISISSRGELFRVEVSDDGPGIPATARRRLFDPFYRIRSDVGEGVSGTGLGLSIARTLAEAQGGSLELEASERGATFALLLKRHSNGKDAPTE